jgi:predicted RNA-binding protein (TIGR00451 family)
MYPYGQCVFPGQAAGAGESGINRLENDDDGSGTGPKDAGDIDMDAPDEYGIATARLEEFCTTHGYRRRLVWSRRVPLDEFIEDVLKLSREDDTTRSQDGEEAEVQGRDNRDARDIQRVRAVCDHQFGRGSFDSIAGGEEGMARLKLTRSRNTGKLRNVHDGEGGHLLSMRAEDGLMILKRAGAVNLHSRLDTPSLRVTVTDDSVPFNREGKSVFAHFVTDCDPDIIPGDEVMVVDREDTLVAVGQAVMGAREMMDFQSGMAVDVREGLASRM